MDCDTFITAYNASRNGANTMYRHPLVRKFIYSDGVKDCADAGCHWLLDILATELPAAFRSHQLNPQASTSCVITARVNHSAADLSAEFTDNAITWRRHINYTDMPDGEWKFYLNDEGDHYACILLSEY